MAYSSSDSDTDLNTGGAAADAVAAGSDDTRIPLLGALDERLVAAKDVNALKSAARQLVKLQEGCLSYFFHCYCCRAGGHIEAAITAAGGRVISTDPQSDAVAKLNTALTTKKTALNTERQIAKEEKNCLAFYLQCYGCSPSPATRKAIRYGIALLVLTVTTGGLVAWHFASAGGGNGNASTGGGGSSGSCQDPLLANDGKIAAGTLPDGTYTGTELAGGNNLMQPLAETVAGTISTIGAVVGLIQTTLKQAADQAGCTEVNVDEPVEGYPGVYKSGGLTCPTAYAFNQAFGDTEFVLADLNAETAGDDSKKVDTGWFETLRSWFGFGSEAGAVLVDAHSETCPAKPATVSIETNVLPAPSASPTPSPKVTPSSTASPSFNATGNSTATSVFRKAAEALGCLRGGRGMRAAAAADADSELAQPSTPPAGVFGGVADATASPQPAPDVTAPDH